MTSSTARTGSIYPWRPPTHSSRKDDVRTWFREYEHHLNAVSLFGTEAAWQAANQLHEAMGEAMDADTYAGEAENRFLAAYDAVIRAMRPDTAAKD